MDRQWNEDSKFLIVLSVKDELTLRRFAQDATDCGIPYAVWREPDIGNEVTGIALAPGKESELLCSQLPLALREYEELMEEAV